MRTLPDRAMFTYADALDLGWTMSALKNAVRRGRVVRIRRGVYATTGGSPAMQARAAALTHPGAVVSDRSAALVRGLPVLGRPPQRPAVTVRPRANANLAGVHVYRARLREHDVVTADGFTTTSIARTLGDLARHHPTGLAVAAADHALHHHLTTTADIADVLDFCRDWPGARRARRSMSLVDGRAESPLESISRLAVVRLGLPRPEPQVEIVDRRGFFVGRADFYWDEFGVVGEADGRSKYDEGGPVLTDEKDRQENLENLGLVVVRWGWRQADRDVAVLKRRLENGFERGRLRDRSGFPRLWTFRPTPERP